MNSTKKYYQSIYSRFSKPSQDDIYESSNPIQSFEPSQELSSESQLNSEYLEMFSDILKNKREAKNLRKIHDEMFDTYVKNLDYINLDTAKAYSKMISEFIMYSPGVNPDDLELFLKKKFSITNNGRNFKSKLKGTPLKYYRCIEGFLKIIFSGEYSSLNPEYLQSSSEISSKKKIFPSVLEVVNAYVELMNLKKYEDATIIHLIYSLGINLETLVLLTFDSIDDENNLTYFDTLSLKYVTVKINENLKRDILFLKEVNLANNLKTNEEFKCYKDKAVIMGKFMILATPSAIYNRFARNFGGKLKWFRYSPDQIIALSKATLLILENKKRDECLDLINNSIQVANHHLDQN